MQTSVTDKVKIDENGPKELNPIHQVGDDDENKEVLGSSGSFSSSAEDPHQANIRSPGNFSSCNFYYFATVKVIYFLIYSMILLQTTSIF